VTWLVVLVKDFDTAKQRLSPALEPAARRELAMANARRAIRAAGGFGPVLVVAGSQEAAALARKLGAAVFLEAQPRGQNPAAAAGIAFATARGAHSVLVLSSDLPRVSRSALRVLLEAAGERSPVAVAAAATGRGGTNALLLRPPGAIGLHFGDQSLRRFEGDARGRGVPFEVVEHPHLALDLDEPADLVALS
jgi:2-phospho-L-lactate/phosphoenolpyruvate guanylyltransferase